MRKLKRFLGRLHPAKRPVHSLNKFMAHALTGTVHDLRDLDWRYGVPLAAVVVAAVSVISYYSVNPKIEWTASSIAKEVTRYVRSSDKPTTVSAHRWGYSSTSVRASSRGADCSDACVYRDHGSDNDAGSRGARPSQEH